MQDLNLSNLDDEIQVEVIPTSRIYKNHPQSNIIGDLNERITRSMNKTTNVCLFSRFLSQTIPKSITEALQDSRWIEAMPEEFLQFQL